MKQERLMSCPPLPADASDRAIRDDLLLTLLTASSFEHAMQHLYGALTRFVPAEFMICYSVNHESSHATTLTCMGNMDRAPLLEATKIHLLTHEDRHTHAYDKERAIFWHNDYRDDAVIRQNLRTILPSAFSVMGMTLNETPKSHIIVAVVADSAHGFAEADVDILRRLHPLFRHVMETFFPPTIELPTGLVPPSERAKTAWKILQECKGMTPALRRAEAVALTDVGVLIEGESGVGKDVLARAVHHLSGRARMPLVVCNCGALPDTLLDSLLFGHEKGSFTGAMTKGTGYFEQAQNGTLFLDEVGELTAAAQARLLRVLEDRTFRRVGGDRPLPLNVRIIAATNRDLKELVRQGLFRQDLWYRLSRYRITVPPLRRRREDIPVLVRYYCMTSPEELNLPGPFQLASESLPHLLTARWPGNVRQLKHVLEEAMINAALAQQHTIRITPGALDEEPPLTAKNMASQPQNPESGGSQPAQTREKKASSGKTRGAPDEEELKEAIAASRGRISGPLGAAARLGVNPQTLRSRLIRMGFSPRELRERYA